MILHHHLAFNYLIIAENARVNYVVFADDALSTLSHFSY